LALLDSDPSLNESLLQQLKASAEQRLKGLP